MDLLAALQPIGGGRIDMAGTLAQFAGGWLALFTRVIAGDVGVIPADVAGLSHQSPGLALANLTYSLDQAALR